MKKNVLSCLLAVLLLFGAAAAPQQVFAAGTVEISTVSGAKGEVVEVSVSLKSDDVYSGNFNIRYDSKVLELVSANSEAAPSIYCVVNGADEGAVRVTFTGVAEPIKDTVLCKLVFRITADTPPGGSAVSAEQLRLYNANGVTVDASAIAGSVAKKTAHLGLSSSETAEYQAVGVTVRLDGGLHAAGGSFTFTYDPKCFQVRSVQALDSLKGAVMTYNVKKDGVLSVAFSSTKEIADGNLCTIVLQTISKEQADSAVRLTDVRLYDENSQPLDTSVTDGTISVTAPSSRDPKLWIVGGALQDDGTATVAVVLQGRGVTCGGNFDLCFDSSMKAEVESSIAEYQIENADGTIHVSWASALPYADEQQLMVIKFSGATDGKKLDFDSVKLYGESSTLISVVDVRPATIEKQSGVTAVVDEKNCSVDSTSSGKTYTVAVDVADLQHFSSGNAVSTVEPMLALYQGGRLVGLSAAGTMTLTGGVGELSLSAAAKEDVTEMRVFLMDAGGDYSPLCAALQAMPNASAAGK